MKDAKEKIVISRSVIQSPQHLPKLQLAANLLLLSFLLVLR
jgi:hypothetical protein